MKFCLVLLAVLGLTHGAHISEKATPSLNDGFLDIVKTIPIKKIENLVLQYLANDEEAQEFVSYMQGAKFAVVWKAIFTSTEVKELMAWMYQKGMPVYKDVNVFADLLEMTHVSPRVAEVPSTRGVAKFLEELFEMMDPQQLIANIKKEVAINPDFKEWYDRLQDEKFHAFVHKIYLMKELQDELTVLRNQKVNVDKIVSEIAGVMGWKDL